MAVAVSQYNDSLEQSISARAKCSAPVSKLTDILLGAYYLLSISCKSNADMLAFVYFFELPSKTVTFRCCCYTYVEHLFELSSHH